MRLSTPPLVTTLTRIVSCDTIALYSVLLIFLLLGSPRLAMPHTYILLFEHARASYVFRGSRVWTKRSENLTLISRCICSTDTGTCTGSAELFFRHFRPYPSTTSDPSKLILSLAVAALANTASLICGSESVSGVLRSSCFSFSILRNLELPLSWFRGQMRGTLRASSAVTSHSVYEDIFVFGKCFPQLANPPIRKLHYL